MSVSTWKKNGVLRVGIDSAAPPFAKINVGITTLNPLNDIVLTYKSVLLWRFERFARSMDS